MRFSGAVQSGGECQQSMLMNETADKRDCVSVAQCNSVEIRASKAYLRDCAVEQSIMMSVTSA